MHKFVTSAAGNNGSPASDFAYHTYNRLLTTFGRNLFADISWEANEVGIQLGVVGFIPVRKLGVRLLHSAVHGL